LDDRLIHGQVVVGWGQALSADHILLIDDQVAQNEWERDLYRMGVPPGMKVDFVAIDDAGAALDSSAKDGSRTMVIVADIPTLLAACGASRAVARVNVGGVHEGEGRIRRLRYVFLTEEEAKSLQALAEKGIEVSAQDVPSGKAVPISEFT
jgi:PTS system mannose-specific IIB component/fructoselysine and glucoselysine-specific PTS system IIB component